MRRIPDLTHGELKLHEQTVALSRTRACMRLHNLHQLGTMFMHRPSASHTRYSHVLRTAHLAGLLVRRIREQFPDAVDERDVLVAEVAGLTHDWGHGPFSHVFEKVVDNLGLCPGWNHERMGMDMLRWTRSQRPDIDEMLTDEEWTMVERMVMGSYEGVALTKQFMVDAISNPTCGLDVDKLEYMSSDFHMLDMSGFCSRKAHAIIDAASLTEVDGALRLAFDLSVMEKIGDLFMSRAKLHSRGCMTVEELALKHQMFDFFTKADELHPVIKTALSSPEQFLFMTDNVVTMYKMGVFGEPSKPALKSADRFLTMNTLPLLGKLFWSTSIKMKSVRTELDKIEGIVPMFAYSSMGRGKVDPLSLVPFVDTSAAPGVPRRAVDSTVVEIMRKSMMIPSKSESSLVFVLFDPDVISREEAMGAVRDVVSSTTMAFVPSK